MSRVPGIFHAPHRPSFNRPFSDGSMTIETDMLTSLDNSTHLAMTSPFSLPQSLPNQPTFNHHFDIHPLSPHAELHGFNTFHFGQSTDNPEPPIRAPAARSVSASRSPQNGKAPASRHRPARKLSLSDARPHQAGNQQRGRSITSARPTTAQNHPRTMSHSDAFNRRLGLGIGLDTHMEGERTDSITPPEYGTGGHFGFTVSQGHSGGPASWSSSTPSLVPGCFGSFTGNNDEAIADRSAEFSGCPADLD